MKEGFDKEIDSLLRGLPGTTAGPRARGNGAPAAKADAHLDADELSAFVEGALPAAARLSVSAHLADCDECRGLAVSLTRAAGVEGEIERRAAVPALAEASKPSRRRSWLAALFAPGALRYVAPALALCLIAAVSFVALRSRRTEERLAQAGNISAPRADITDNQSSAETNGVLQSPSNTTSNANVTVTSSATNNAANRGAASTNAAASDQTTRESPAGSASSSAAASDKLDRVAEPPAPAMKDAPAAAPVVESPARNETVEVTNTSERPKEAQTETGAGQSQPQQRTSLSNAELRQQSPDGSRNRSSVNGAQNNSAGGLVAGNTREDRDSSSATTSASASRRKPSDEKRPKKTEESKAAEGDDEDGRKGETRSAAGHSFRREGGAWVDVNYKSSMSSTGVRRGTDSFRALVADIPELGRVAEQLGGEVVVVIRGRAYRIR
jgi:hypothetical protein